MEHFSELYSEFNPARLQVEAHRYRMWHDYNLWIERHTSKIPIQSIFNLPEKYKGKLHSGFHEQQLKMSDRFYTAVFCTMILRKNCLYVEGFVKLNDRIFRHAWNNFGGVHFDVMREFNSELKGKKMEYHRTLILRPNNLYDLYKTATESMETPMDHFWRNQIIGKDAFDSDCFLYAPHYGNWSFQSH